MSKKSFLRFEKDVWLVKGKETGKIYVKYRLKMNAINDLKKIQKDAMEECEIVFEDEIN